MKRGTIKSFGKSDLEKRNIEVDKMLADMKHNLSIENNWEEKAEARDKQWSDQNKHWNRQQAYWFVTLALMVMTLVLVLIFDIKVR